MKITVNLPSYSISQGQLCVFQEYVDDSITVYVAPPGIRSLPDTDAYGNYQFALSRWKLLTLRRISGFIVAYKGNSLRRTQFPLKNFLAMTIHKAMGETIGRVVTKISSVEREYCPWQRKQIYVIVSRVRCLSYITFLGNKTTTLSSIKTLLQKGNQWDTYTETIVDASSNCPQHVVNLVRYCPFRPNKLKFQRKAMGLCIFSQYEAT